MQEQGIFLLLIAPPAPASLKEVLVEILLTREPFLIPSMPRHVRFEHLFNYN